MNSNSVRCDVQGIGKARSYRTSAIALHCGGNARQADRKSHKRYDNPRLKSFHRPSSWLLRMIVNYRQFANGFGRTWMCSILPIRVSVNFGMYELYVAQIPRPFQPARGSSMRPSTPRVKNGMG